MCTLILIFLPAIHTKVRKWLRGLFLTEPLNLTARGPGTETKEATLAPEKEELNYLYAGDRMAHLATQRANDETETNNKELRKNRRL